MATQASYEALLQSAIDTATGAKTLTMDTVLSVSSSGDVLKVGIGTDREEWFEITGVTTGDSTITTGARGLSLTVTGTLTEVAGNRKTHYKGEKCAVVVFPNKIHLQNTDTGTTGDTFTISSGNDYAKLDTTGLSDDRTYTFQDVSGELITDTSPTVTTPTLTSPVINTAVSGSAISNVISSPGSATILANTRDVVDYFVAISPGVLSLQADGGTQQSGYMDLISGDSFTITDNADDSFTFDVNPDDANLILHTQVFS